MIGDGKVLFKSGIVRGGDKTQVIDLPLKGIGILILQVTDGGNNMNSDHAN